MLKRFAQATKQYVERGTPVNFAAPVCCNDQQRHLSCVAVQNPIPPSEKVLFSFNTEKDLARWSTFTDQEFGGQSEASLALSQTSPVCNTAIRPAKADDLLR